MLINFFEKGGKVTVPTYYGNMLINYLERGGKVRVPTFLACTLNLWLILFLFGTNHAAFQYLLSFHLSFFTVVSRYMNHKGDDGLNLHP